MKIKVMMAGVPQGSHQAFMFKGKDGKTHARVTDTNRNSIYAERIAIAEEFERKEGKKFERGMPVGVDIKFGFIKPKSKPKKVKHMVVKPDIDKLTRAVLDALTGLAFDDDSQVIELKASKFYSDTEYIEIIVYPIANTEQTIL